MSRSPVSAARGTSLIAPDAAPQERPRAEQQVHRVSGAVARALTHQPGLDLRGRQWVLNGAPVHARAPHVHPAVDRDDWCSFRGATDAVALLVTHSDPALRAATCPEDDVLSALVFEFLEQLRVESLAEPALPGVASNLERRFQAWSKQVTGSGLLETEQGLLVFAIAHMCRSRLLMTTLDPSVAHTVEATRWGIVGAIGKDLALLRARRHDQRGYAFPAARIARTIAAQVAAARSNGPDEGPDDVHEVDANRGLSLLVGFGMESLPHVRNANLGGGHPVEDKYVGYRVFTRSHDRVDPAAALVPATQLAALLSELTRLVKESGLHANRLAQAATAALGSPEWRGQNRDLEEGELDPQALTRLVTHPGDGRVFRSSRRGRGTHAAVTFLIDFSGSMKQYADRLAPLLDVLARALTRAGVTTEVLGYTTVTWGGVKAHKTWQRAGRPPFPGRLTETQHLVLLDAHMTWHRGRAGLAALLRPNLYRESVDGEAVQWAAERLASIEANRRILAVICDGSPMETSTMRTNGPTYLDRHLRDTVDALGRGGLIEVKGLGVGLNLGRYYGDYAVLDLDGPLPHAARELLELLARPPRATRR